MSHSASGWLSLRVIWFLVTVSLGMTGKASAQVGASLTGVVTDRSGAVVARAKVKVTNQQNGQSQVVATADAGDFHFFNLPPASYSVEVSLTGFGDVTKRIELLVGTDQVMNFDVGVAGTSQLVTVDAGGDNTISY